MPGDAPGRRLKSRLKSRPAASRRHWDRRKSGSTRSAVARRTPLPSWCESIESCPHSQRHLQSSIFQFYGCNMLGVEIEQAHEGFIAAVIDRAGLNWAAFWPLSALVLAEVEAGSA